MSAASPHPQAPGHDDFYDEDDEGMGLLDLFVVLRANLKKLVLVPLAVGLAGLGIAFVIPPTFTAVTTFLPPQQQQSGIASSLASLGALAGLAGAGAVKSPADQYVSLMQSATVEDRIVERFQLVALYESKFRADARKKLEKNARINVGKKDGLISVEVDDESPQRAADMANAFVDELRTLTSSLAVTEAQQRRVFFEHQLQQTRDRLTAAQIALQGSGFSQGALQAEPKAAAEAYARLRAEITAAEVRVQTMRGYLNENAPEFQSAQTTLAAVRGQLAKLEQARGPASSDSDYIGKYREFKYQETLFDLFSRQYELARVDESREGALIQVVDTATPPERKSKPSRALVAIGSFAAALLAMVIFVLARHAWRQNLADPRTAQRLAALRASLDAPAGR